MRTGDISKHIPSGEKWLVAWADEHEVICCGWPESIARSSDCELITACSDEDHWALVRAIAAGQHDSYRRNRCFAALEQKRAEECAGMMRI